jgi:hypothetical protein
MGLEASISPAKPVAGESKPMKPRRERILRGVMMKKRRYYEEGGAKLRNSRSNSRKR